MEDIRERLLSGVFIKIIEPKQLHLIVFSVFLSDCLYVFFSFVNVRNGSIDLSESFSYSTYDSALCPVCMLIGLF